MSKQSSWREQIRELCHQEGLVYLGTVALSGEEPAYASFKDWIDEGKHAEMSFLERNQHLRQRPQHLLGSAAKSAMIIGLPYYEASKKAGPRIAKYARYKDYHKVLWRKNERVAKGFLASMSGVMSKVSDFDPRQVSFRVTVDSAPLLERALAARTSRGFIGKNTCYIHPVHGSWLLLSEIHWNYAFEPDSPANVSKDRRSPEGGCGSCRRCQVFCPTGALDQEYQLDARRCLAYWTIEHRGTIPTEFWPFLKTYYFGCDICQDVCPYNRGVEASASAHQPVAALEQLTLDRIAKMSQGEYEAWFGGTPLTRAKRAGLMRNALIALHETDKFAYKSVKGYITSRAREDDPSFSVPELVLQTIAQADSLETLVHDC